MTLPDITKVFRQSAGRLILEERAVLDEIGKMVASRARAKLGVYQSAVGPFPAWAPLSPVTIDRKGSDTPLYDTGELKETGIDYEVHGMSVEIGSDLLRALWAELGTASEPPRPFLGPAAYESIEEIKKLVGIAAVSAFYKSGKRIF